MGTWSREQLLDIAGKGGHFRNMKLHGAIFDEMNLEKADFRGASVPWAKFRKCNLKFAIFEGANCTGADFDGANVHRANFKDAIMCDAKFDVTDAFGITITMDCKCFSHLRVNTGFYLGLLFYGFLMDPIPGPTFVPEEFKEKLSILFGPEKYNTLKKQYSQRQM